MPHPTLSDMASRTMPKKRWIPKKDFKPGGEKGKLHRELGVPEGEKIPKARLASAARSDNPEVSRDAKRAQTMGKWSKVHNHPRSAR